MMMAVRQLPGDSRECTLEVLRRTIRFIIDLITYLLLHSVSQRCHRTQDGRPCSALYTKQLVEPLLRRFHMESSTIHSFLPSF